MGHLAVIPARQGSVGLLGKNMALLGGKPLVQLAIEQAQACGVFTSIVVSSDWDAVLGVAKDCGAEPLLRPLSLAGGDVLAGAVIKHVLDEVGWDYETVTLLNPTSPLREPWDISATHAAMKETGAQSALSAVATRPIIMCRRRSSRREFWHVASLCIPNRQRRRPMYVQNGAVYVVCVSYFKETGNLVSEKCAVHVMPQERSIDIDTPWDYLAAQAWFAETQKVRGRALGRVEARDSVAGAVLPASVP